jgi:hypothetical protein
MDDVLVEYPSYERQRVALQRAVQAEALAKCVYGKILSSDLLTSQFSNEAWLDELWARCDDELMRFWGAPVNLREIDPPPLSFSDLE